MGASASEEDEITKTDDIPRIPRTRRVREIVERVGGALVVAVVVTAVVLHLQPPAPEAARERARVVNLSDAGTEVYVSFGAGSEVDGSTWTFCTPTPSGCAFPLDSDASRVLPAGSKELSVNISFDQPGGCQGSGIDLGEFTINAGAYDTADISMVNGWNADMRIDVVDGEHHLTLGPTQGPDSGAGIYGIFPNGCDICVARQNPPCAWQTECGTPEGGGAPCGCQGGTQYNPSPVCQVTPLPPDSYVTVVLLHH
jgi:hypothetical protein